MIQRAIEPVSPDDYAAITDVWEASVRATHYFLTEAHIQFFRPLVQHSYLKDVDLRCIRNEAGTILGFVGVAGTRLEMLFIHPAARGQGTGRQLLRYAIETLGIYEVDVNEQNQQAVGFYEHMGFRTFHRASVDSLGNPFPVLTMRLLRKTT
jgi:putative acetyltransferase